MTATLLAHSGNGNGERHALDAHLRGTAARAREFGDVFGAGALAGHLGLLHDVGKGACAWQDGLMRAEAVGGRVGIDHKLAGTWLACDAAKLGPFALAVRGHHGGLDHARVLKDDVRSAEGDERDRVMEAVRRVSESVPEILEDHRSAVPPWCERDGHGAELLLRMVFSALVDADYLDTEEHFAGTRRPGVASLSTMAQSYERAREEYLERAEPSPVDRIRTEVYEQAVAAAAQPVGVFPFPAPTGAGKTIAAGGFAVHHAAHHGLRRVIVAVPFISITEQNATVYRRLFGDAHVVEQHSGVDLDGLPPCRRWQRLAAENWDAPVVVTTTVRLFESLFSRKPSAMRKLHRLAGSVIVLDEVQALPDAMLLPILSVLRYLTEHFGTSVVLASATQPAFFSLKPFQDLRPREVIAQPKPLYERLRRVQYEWWCEQKPTFAEVAAKAAGHEQALLIVNTTGDAALLHQELEKIAHEGMPVLHLSTRMAGGHRRQVLGEITQLLKASRPVIVVSTQLVEAGVDLDFPVVFRALAPAEALQQAAGRSNRNEWLADGRVVIFYPADGSRKGPQLVYGAALATSKAHFGPDLADPDDLEVLNAYYRARYAVKNIEGSSVGRQIQDLRKDLDFPGVAELFKMIDEPTVPVVVPYGDAAERRRLVEILTGPERAERWAYRKIQPYLAALPRNLVTGRGSAVDQGLATLLVGDLYEWHGGYHPQRGIEFTHPEPEDYVW